MSDRRRKFRCSQLAQVLFCPGSALLGERVRQSKDSAASLLGQWCHFAGAERLVREQGATAPANFVGPKMPEGWEPAGFQRWIVDFYYSTVLDYAHVDMALEVEAEFAWAFSRFDLTGHIDVFGITADATEAFGMDLKAGSEQVDDAEQNAQILGYIVLLLLNYPTLRKISFAIVQPQNNPDEGFERVTFATVEGEQLAGVAAYLERELNYAIDHERELNSDSWKACRYCPAADQCPCIDADLAQMKITLTDAHLAAISNEPTVAKLLDLEFAKKKFEPIFERAHADLKARVKRDGPQEVNGTRVFVEEKPGRRTISGNEDVASKLADLPDELYHQTYEFKATELEKVLAKHHGVPVDSKKNRCGKSILKDLLGSHMSQATVEWLRIGSS